MCSDAPARGCRLVALAALLTAAALATLVLWQPTRVDAQPSPPIASTDAPLAVVTRTLAHAPRPTTTITIPPADSTISRAGLFLIQGMAYADCDRRGAEVTWVERVEVQIDGGRWQSAELDDPEACVTRWQTPWNVPAGVIGTSVIQARTITRRFDL
ncbi:MAG: hypothetical protein NZ518_07750, partial [Dehalococcoidia bacterium]|nr:hypothetical protein [Dehalococcoidia bacterium]